ncbi:hypothetical protein QVG61_10735 [Thiohalobacter sp. IOR34]|uniref:hypothetical protein n=1 Tax=Thiohalobacter sp. IOR34 TaxID=3057176 RepID=UPI0025B168ED|nr:hypothetical protein [Thiohalobacter sp. IOR34]WJW74969.1 hypothetical protein QVG61_10735 [Thiohalobacter sp. IOR34]
MKAEQEKRPCEERRRFFRVEDEAFISCRPIDEAELEGLKERVADRLPDRFTVAATFASNSRIMNRMLQGFAFNAPEMGRYLRMMDQKLNQLARLFVMESMADIDAEPRRINVSACGLVFPSATEYQPDDLLEFRLVLLPSMVGILMAARVVYCERSPMGGSHPWQVAISYEYIRENDRDLLCSHLLSKETEQRRRQREEEEEGGG